MKRNLWISLLALTILASCNKNEKILSSLQDYNASKQDVGYHFGDKFNLPSEVTDNAENVTISFGDKEVPVSTVDPKYFVLGDNDITFNIKTKDGKVLNQDATIKVLAKTPEQTLTYQVVKEYPHDVKSFTEGLEVIGNTVYESIGQKGESKLLKYTLGSSTPSQSVALAGDYFGEGTTVLGDKIYQLTWQNKVGLIYDKNTFKQIGQFQFAPEINEGWGLTNDGKNLITSDGTSKIYYLDPANPSKIVRYIGIANNKEIYTSINELEYHNGYIYSNVWQKPYILKINPNTGEVVGKFDFSELTKKNTKGSDDVLNGIAFNGDNMLVTGKNWSKIYEVKIK